MANENTMIGDVNRIDLRLIDGLWIAEYSGPYAEYMRTEFGSTSAPTPFTGQTPAEDVERAIRDRNPRFVVEAH